MVVFQIPIDKPKPFRTAKERLKARQRRDAALQREESNRVPLRGKLSRFANRPLKDQTSSSVLPVSIEPKPGKPSKNATWWKPKIVSVLPKTTMKQPVSKPIKKKIISNKPRLVLRIDPTIKKVSRPTINKGEIAHFNKDNIKTATILPSETPVQNVGIEKTMKVTGLTAAELQQALTVAATRINNKLSKKG